MQFTLCVFDYFQRRANTSNSNYVSIIHRNDSSNASNKTNTVEKLVVINMDLVGEGVKNLSYSTITRKIEV